MKIPESFFKFINPCMALLLRTPVHWILSGSVMVIYFTGRKSGRELYTPVRYSREGNQLICFTGTEARWWHNFVQPTPVQLRVRGQLLAARAQATLGRGPAVRDELERFLTRFPQDAIYHDLHWGADGKLIEAELQAVLPHVVMVMFELKDSQS